MKETPAQKLYKALDNLTSALFIGEDPGFDSLTPHVKASVSKALRVMSDLDGIVWESQERRTGKRGGAQRKHRTRRRV